MNRRDFARLSAATAGLAFLSSACGAVQYGQKPTRLARVGLLSSEFADSPWHTPLWDGLHELGWTEGQNLIVERRYAEDRQERLPELAAELVGLGVDLIVAEGTPPALAAQRTTRTIPVVFIASGDPVGVGLVTSLARPGGNVTGLSMQGTSSAQKQLELLLAVVPGLARLGVIQSDNPAGLLALASIQAAATAHGVQVQHLKVLSPGDLNGAFDLAHQWPANGIIVRGDLFLVNQRRAPIVDLAARAGVPALYSYREQVAAGGLMCFGSVLGEAWQREAKHVDKILKGANPADLPVEQVDTFEIAVNLTTAHSLGLTIPPDLAVQVTEWIQ